jgi:hypothetical protein
MGTGSVVPQRPQHHLFSYLGDLGEGILMSLSEVEDLVGELREYEPHGFAPGVREGREARTASIRADRRFKYILLTLTGALDMFAEVVALLLSGAIQNLPVGRADFGKLRRFFEDPVPDPGGIVTPRVHYAQLLHARLRPLVVCEGAEADWLEITELYRNKYAHTGSATLPILSLQQRNGEYHPFLPNQWPLILEEFYEPAGTVPRATPEQFH